MKKSYLIIYKEGDREFLMRQYGMSVTDAVTPIENAGIEIISVIADNRPLKP